MWWGASAHVLGSTMGGDTDGACTSTGSDRGDAGEAAWDSANTHTHTHTHTKTAQHVIKIATHTSR